MDIAALVATLNRPKGLTRVLLSLRDTSPNVFRVVARDSDDSEAQTIAKRLADMTVVVPEKRLGPAAAWNVALENACNFDAYILAADDLVFGTRWLEETLIELEKLGGSGLVGFNDGKVISDFLFCTHFLMTRDFMIKHHGGVMAIPHYDGNGVDVEASERAQGAGLYAKAEDALVFHDWRGGGAGADETYKIGASRRRRAARIIRDRRSEDWPDDFEPIIFERQYATL